MTGGYDPDEAAADLEVRARVLGSVTPAETPAPAEVPAPVMGRRAAYLIPILTAVLAGGATWLGATVASDATLAAQREQIAESRATAERTKRAEVYVRFLDRANIYAYAADEATRCLAGADDVDEGVSKCGTLVGAQLTARNQFQKSRNEVFFFGSQAAEDTGTLLAGTLPDAVGPVSPEMYRPIDFDLYGQRYSDFNRVVCRDVQTDPTRVCE